MGIVTVFSSNEIYRQLPEEALPPSLAGTRAGVCVNTLTLVHAVHQCKVLREALWAMNESVMERKDFSSVLSNGPRATEGPFSSLESQVKALELMVFEQQSFFLLFGLL